jgi:hypothetical protein
MTEFPAAMPHGPLKEVFPNVFFVTGTMRGEFFGSTWQFSRNMIVVREENRLSLINAVRLSDEGLKHLESLGEVRAVVRIGSMHGVDDAFYVARYGAKHWAMRGAPDSHGLAVDEELYEGGPLPFGDASLFSFTTTKLPEGIIRLAREGGVLLACDALQNWVGPDEFFLPETVETMTKMGFFMGSNLGPAWMHVNEPKAEDFVRLKKLGFRHALTGHGEPRLNDAQESYHATFARIFGV